jgi:iron complex outermembrane recepter protein
MFKLNQKASAWSMAFAAIATAASIGTAPTVYGQEQAVETVIVTGSRIRRPGLSSSSPITSIGLEEIEFQQEVEVEQILRDLPSTIPGDGQNVNNGTDGVSTVNLRALGPERNLVLLNGRRMTPANYNGRVDLSTIPSALIERIDVITGGASAVYGSDAIAGAVNVVLKQDFEGFDLQINNTTSGDNDADTDNISLTLGSALEGGRGHVALNLSYANREAVLLGARPLGQLGIETADGSGLAEFNAGQSAALPPTNCQAPGAVQSGGSTTSIPTRANIAGAGNVGQFQEDRTLFTGDAGRGPREGCSLFNFNPFNFYQTPNERYNAFFTGNFEFNENLEVYSTVSYSNITVDAQVAPSGTFGAQFNVPMANPFLGDQARGEILSFANSSVALGTLSAGGQGDNWNDVNGNGIVDEADYLKMQLRRRTLELGPRSEKYDTEYFTFLAGARGQLLGDWNYDVSFQYGESNRTTVRDGYTNLTNIQNALDSVDGVTCANGDSSCVPIDLFGGFGTITGPMAGYARAVAFQQQKYDQSIGQIVLDGPVDFIQVPSASTPLALSVGFETRDEFGSLNPDECLKLAPASCQGGAGGNLLPIAGGFRVDEFFVEGFLPLVDGMDFVDSLNFEFGYRDSDYNTVGNVDTWKAGLNWNVNDQLLIRVMEQEATRAPNIAELYSPITTALRNATQDPCSVANAGNIDARLQALCESTGMLPAQVGVLQDIVSGQVNTLEGSSLTNAPNAETAETFTAGFVWTPDLPIFENVMLSVDYYDIDITDVIGEFSAQEVLDQCYVLGNAASCANVVRVDGDLTTPASGIRRLTTNLDYEKSTGYEIGFNFGYDLGEFGDLSFSGNINKYSEQESQSSSTSPVIDCSGFFGTSCDPVSDMRWTQRTTWNWNDLTASLQWRHIGSVDIERPEAAATFAGFRYIDDYDYLDAYVSYNLWDDRVRISVGIDNITDEDPPVVGNEAGDTSSNSGNTFPSNYDTLGRMYTFGARLSF